MKIREEFTCPLELIHDMIKGKWKPIILWRLRLGATSLSKLERDIDGITQKMLLEQLRELMDYGFVKKTTFEGYPLRVEYSLTEDMGEDILAALKIMQHIGIDYMKKNGMEHILEEKGVVPEYTDKIPRMKFPVYTSVSKRNFNSHLRQNILRSFGISLAHTLPSDKH